MASLGTLHAEELMYLLRQAHIDYAQLSSNSPELRVIDNLVRTFELRERNNRLNEYFLRRPCGHRLP